VAVEPPLCCSPSRVICASEELLALRASFGQSNRNRLLTAPDLDVTALATAPALLYWPLLSIWAF
jgi:hypothetical protein